MAQSLFIAKKIIKLSYKEFIQRFRPQEQTNLASAIKYFIAPTPENIDSINKQLKSGTLSRRNIWTATEINGNVRIEPGIKTIDRFAFIITKSSWTQNDIMVTL